MQNQRRPQQNQRRHVQRRDAGYTYRSTRQANPRNGQMVRSEKRRPTTSVQKTRNLPPQIVHVELVNQYSSGKSNVGKAVAGGLLFGAVGAVIGASSNNTKTNVTFRVTYDNGKINYVHCVAGDFIYSQYINIMENLDRMHNDPTYKPPGKVATTFNLAMLILYLAGCVVALIGLCWFIWWIITL